eukprot:1122171-Prorocentrum_minimum.AAC.1
MPSPLSSADPLDPARLSGVRGAQAPAGGVGAVVRERPADTAPHPHRDQRGQQQHGGVLPARRGALRDPEPGAGKEALPGAPF